MHQRPFISRRILLVAGVFLMALLALQAWRSWVLLASYDQGIFQQVLWNNLHGHWFESTLSSQLSTNVIHNGAPNHEGIPKRCPRPENWPGALAGPTFVAEPDDQSESAVQPAFSAISRP